MTMIPNTKCSTFKQYCLDRSGQFAMYFAIAAFPVLVATTYAVDFRGAEKDRSNIKSALDVAVLTAVSNDRVSKTEKKDLAREVFKTHYNGQAKVNLDVAVSDGRVEMTAEGSKEASLARAVGAKGFKLQETSIAEMNRENTICVLALANEGRHKLQFLDGTEFNSPTCSVQSNSRDNQGVFSNSRFDPVAKSFCSAGGAKGDFKPAMRGECRVIEDPYATRKAPTPGVCMPKKLFSVAPALPSLTSAVGTIASGVTSNGHEPGTRIINNGNGKHTHQHCHLGNGHCHSGSHDIDTIHAPTPGLRLQNIGLSPMAISRLVTDYGLKSLLVTESENYTGSNRVFYPGTYCGGLTVDGKNVRFAPGTYIIKDGPLTFKNGASAKAVDVSFVMTGGNAVVTVESGSYVDVKAPKTGPMAGLAFFQDQHNVSSPMGGKKDRFRSLPMADSAQLAADRDIKKDPNTPKQPSAATGVNLISSGGELNVTGTMYFPTQALDVVGDSVLGAKAPATSFIAYQVTFSGETKAAVAVDYVKGGIPPMLPRSDDGARLVE